jgi:DeoR family transcriptional regulator, copper-sensing transcriptional repressor
MSNLPSQRQEHILKWLQEAQSLSIEAISQHFGVSIMTVHRDLAVLSEQGLVEKVHGGVMLPKARPESSSLCRMCGILIQARTGLIIHLTSGDNFPACCPHCGLMLMAGQAIKSALAPDVIYQRMINVLQAYYVLGSRVTLCCAPSLLCFADQADALSFQAGFGGEVLNYVQAQQSLSHQHHHHGKH